MVKCYEAYHQKTNILNLRTFNECKLQVIPELTEMLNRVFVSCSLTAVFCTCVCSVISTETMFDPCFLIWLGRMVAVNSWKQHTNIYLLFFPGDTKNITCDFSHDSALQCGYQDISEGPFKWNRIRNIYDGGK